MSAQPGAPPRPPSEDRSAAEIVLEVSERISLLVREEVELAKTEVSEKVTSLLKGSVVGIAAGLFAVLGFAMLMHAIAWLLNDLFFSDDVWIGFAIEAFVWFVIAGVVGFVSYRAVKKGSPPVPRMAIQEGKEIRETLGSGSSSGSVSRSGTGISSAGASETASGIGGGASGSGSGSQS